MTESILDGAGAAPANGAPPATDPGAGGTGTTPTTPGAGGDDWRATLPDDVRGLSTLGEFKDLPSALKAYDSLFRKMGGGPDSLVAIPKDEAGWNAFYAKLGRPETPDGYDLSGAEGLEYFGDDVAGLKAVAHKAGLTPAQTKTLVREMAAIEQASDAKFTETQQQAKAQTEAALKSEWTGEGEFEKNLTLARRANEGLFDEELRQAITDSGLGNNAKFIRALAKVGVGMFSEDGVAGGGNAGGGTDKAAAGQRLAEMNASAEIRKALSDPLHPQHQQFSEERKRLYEQVVGEGNQVLTFDIQV